MCNFSMNLMPRKKINIAKSNKKTFDVIRVNALYARRRLKRCVYQFV